MHHGLVYLGHLARRFSSSGSGWTVCHREPNSQQSFASLQTTEWTTLVTKSGQHGCKYSSWGVLSQLCCVYLHLQPYCRCWRAQSTCWIQRSWIGMLRRTPNSTSAKHALHIHATIHTVFARAPAEEPFLLMRVVCTDTWVAVSCSYCHASVSTTPARTHTVTYTNTYTSAFTPACHPLCAHPHHLLHSFMSVTWINEVQAIANALMTIKEGREKTINDDDNNDVW